MIFEPFGIIHQILILALLLLITSFWFLKKNLFRKINANKAQINKLITNFGQNKGQNSIQMDKNTPNSNYSNPAQNLVQFFAFPIVNFIANLLIFGLFGHCIFYFGGHILRGSFKLTKYLPLHICNLSVYLLLISLIALKLGKKWARDFGTLVYYWSLIPASLAFLFPDLQSRFIFDFEFAEFFWSHFLIILSCFFLFFFANLQTEYNFVFKAIGILAAFGLILIYPLNLILGSNYMYLNRLTESGPMSFFPNPPFHLGVFILLLLLFYSLQFGILKLSQNKK